MQGLGEVPWGSHVCQFFQNGCDLRDTLVPYFKAGLENNERCLFVAMEPFSAENARSALRAAVGNFDRRERADFSWIGTFWLLRRLSDAVFLAASTGLPLRRLKVG